MHRVRMREYKKKNGDDISDLLKCMAEAYTEMSVTCGRMSEMRQ